MRPPAQLSTNASSDGTQSTNGTPGAHSGQLALAQPAQALQHQPLALAALAAHAPGSRATSRPSSNADLDAVVDEAAGLCLGGRRQSTRTDKVRGFQSSLGLQQRGHTMLCRVVLKGHYNGMQAVACSFAPPCCSCSTDQAPSKLKGGSEPGGRVQMVLCVRCIRARQMAPVRADVCKSMASQWPVNWHGMT